jgi:Aldo/keto reductase family
MPGPTGRRRPTPGRPTSLPLSPSTGWASRRGVTGRGIWGEPPNQNQAQTVLRRTVELGVNFIDTADAYGPKVSEELIAEALRPYPDDLDVATKVDSTAACLVTIGPAGVVVSSSRRATAPLPERPWATSTNGS